MVVQTASPVMLTAVRVISRIRSIPMIRPMASTGSPTELKTIVKVTSPTLGIPAVPMDARVVVNQVSMRMENERITQLLKDLRAQIHKGGM